MGSKGKNMSKYITVNKAEAQNFALKRVDFE